MDKANVIDVIDQRILDAAEACFEVDPSPENWTWIENLVSHLVSHQIKKSTKKHTGVTLKTHKND